MFSLQLKRLLRDVNHGGGNRASSMSTSKSQSSDDNALDANTNFYGVDVSQRGNEGRSYEGDPSVSRSLTDTDGWGKIGYMYPPFACTHGLYMYPLR